MHVSAKSVSRPNDVFDDDDYLKALLYHKQYFTTSGVVSMNGNLLTG